MFLCIKTENNNQSELQKSNCSHQLTSVVVPLKTGERSRMMEEEEEEEETFQLYNSESFVEDNRAQH